MVSESFENQQENIVFLQTLIKELLTKHLENETIELDTLMKERLITLNESYNKILKDCEDDCYDSAAVQSELEDMKLQMKKKLDDSPFKPRRNLVDKMTNSDNAIKNSFIQKLQSTFQFDNVVHVAKTKENGNEFSEFYQNSDKLITLYENQSPFEVFNEYLVNKRSQETEEEKEVGKLYVILVASETVILDGLPFLESVFSKTNDKFILYSQDSINTPLCSLLEPYLEVFLIQQDFQILANFQEYSSVPLLDILNQLVLNLEKNQLFYNQEVYSKEYKKEIFLKVLNLEACYYKVLKQTFDEESLEILNNNYKDVSALRNTSPEYGLGKFLHLKKKKDELLKLLSKVTDINNVAEYITLVRSGQYSQKKLTIINNLAKEIYSNLQAAKSSILEIFPNLNDYLVKSYWLIGSDSWSFDLGNSGVHNLLASNKNLNLLIIDSKAKSEQKTVNELGQRKKDIGLYAINFNNAYVASVAAYSSYTHLISSVGEASEFNGPSIVLAYLPYFSETSSPLEILKETKVGVESGYWPLYTYNPFNEDKGLENFILKSNVLNQKLTEFLERENKLTLLSSNIPSRLQNTLSLAKSDEITKSIQKNADDAFAKLLEGLSGPPLTIYYCSDGGNATALAKRLALRATNRGLKGIAASMDTIESVELLNGLGNVVFISSTAGQGEFPQDGKQFIEILKAGQLDGVDLPNLKFSVFGLGDSKYWPRKEDAHYYNKPAKDLWKVLTVLGAQPIVDLGLGDDQDSDGYQTGYVEWEAKLWEQLGVANVNMSGVEEPKPLTNEDMKIQSNFLRGTIVEGLQDTSTGAISASDQQMTKFHGIYMQDDRDIREVRKAQGLEPYYIFMSRVRLPGGIANPSQWLILDKLADESGNGTIKITTRATFQLHGVIKSNLKHVIRGMNSTLMDTVAACGDVNRNVMISALPSNAKVHNQVSEMGTVISEYLLPQTTAYHEIWLEGPDEKDYDPSWPSIFENRKEGPKKKKTLISGNALVDVEPTYGPTYLPRKFKVNIAVPPYNDVDVWSSDVGLIAIVNQETQIVEGYNLYVGGGMGSTHNNTKTYPRTGSSFGFVLPQDVPRAIECVMIVQRDNGDRTNRKHARLKYTIDDLTIPVYKSKTEEIWGKKFLPERSYSITSNIDFFGWVKDETGLNHFTCFIENGRVEDTADLPQKTGFKKICEYFSENKTQGHFRLTGNQHVLISGIEDIHLSAVKSIMKTYKLDNTNFSGLRLSSAACVALPTCGLAMAESERYLPTLITKLEEALEEYGLRHDSIVMRMTGCPNGCARPWLAEIACVGKAPGTYNLLLGGGYHGQRLNKLYRSSIKEEEILDVLKPLLKRWSLERLDGEHFGDFVIRIGVIKPTTEGKYFHDDINEDAL
ncbi:hypothetical protein QEN19_002610 [Hanseniaspora menglaensis]